MPGPLRDPSPRAREALAALRSAAVDTPTGSADRDPDASSPAATGPDDGTSPAPRPPEHDPVSTSDDDVHD